ncbi:ABC transporter ATP-binding protein [Agromyces sp. NPDC049794]|uniref:ABC transporter ATP-binding protein n=1 Tax=unclassified Agromyces TaxID=2639701 RepID=UPI0033FC54EA
MSQDRPVVIEREPADSPALAAPEPSGASSPTVAVRGLRKRFRREDGSIVAAIDDVDLAVEPGEFLVLLGPSGCGKTTLLRTIAGLETPEEGSIEISGRIAFSSERGIAVPPEKRGLSMIFQSYALWPHMTVFRNVAYPLQSRRPRQAKAEVARRVGEALAQVGIPELARQYPAQLSGGQQQRVALARALVSNDDLILFDEPLSNVDAKVREQLRLELVAMQHRLGFTALFVTHDQAEAMELATRIAVIDRGRIAQLGTPHEVYARPATPYVARFIGAINELEGRVVELNGPEVVVDTPHGRVVSTDAAARLSVGDAVVALWRPEHGHLHAAEPVAPNRWLTRIETSMFLGSHTEYTLVAGGAPARLWSPRPDALGAGTSAWLSVEPHEVRVLPLETSSAPTGGEG